MNAQAYIVERELCRRQCGTVFASTRIKTDGPGYIKSRVSRSLCRKCMAPTPMHVAITCYTPGCANTVYSQTFTHPYQVTVRDVTAKCEAHR